MINFIIMLNKIVSPKVVRILLDGPSYPENTTIITVDTPWTMDNPYRTIFLIPDII